MYQIHATKKLLDRVKPVLGRDRAISTTILGDWYATALFWKPQVALLVNESTLLPVLMFLAPATSLSTRFPAQLALTLSAHGVSQNFIEIELTQMLELNFAKTANRSVVGTMDEFTYSADFYCEEFGAGDLLGIATRLSQTPCSRLYNRGVTPERELKRIVSAALPFK